MSRSASFIRIAALSSVVLACLVGCLPLDFSGWEDQVLSFPAPQPLSGPQISEVEPNDDMTAANVVIFDGQVTLVGSIAAKDSFDFDVFALGPAEAGDRVVAELAASAGSDVVLGLFDDGFNLLAYVDYSRGTAAPGRIDLVLRESVDTLYAIAGTRSLSEATRLYNVGISVTPKVGVPASNPQMVVLNFIGASGVRIGRQAPVNVPPFNVAAIDPRFEGKTDEVIQSVLAMVREDYAGLDVDFYLAGDPNIPAGDLTVIHFGTYSDRYLGLADNVDAFNRDGTQNAIIYTDTFSLFNVLRPTQEQIAQVLANVASHELGHLLGLRHTADIHDIMDITASARQMLNDQWHKVADLHSSIMAIGYQDAPTMLSWCVGGTPPVPPANFSAKAQQMAKMTYDPDDFYIPRGWLAENSVQADEAVDDLAQE
ncbi:MAG: matrixin family metalloprotease [Phycisphaerae bacterium]